MILNVYAILVSIARRTYSWNAEQNISIAELIVCLSSLSVYDLIDSLFK